MRDDTRSSSALSPSAIPASDQTSSDQTSSDASAPVSRRLPLAAALLGAFSGTPALVYAAAALWGLGFLALPWSVVLLLVPVLVVVLAARSHGFPGRSRQAETAS